MLVEINNENFEELVLQSKKNVILDFYAEWCGPCKTFLPILEEISNHYENEILFGKVNVDLAQDIGIKYHIISIPNLVFVSKGEKIGNNVGLKSKKDTTEWIEKMRTT
jgi:thioredoxin 1